MNTSNDYNGHTSKLARVFAKAGDTENFGALVGIHGATPQLQEENKLLVLVLIDAERPNAAEKAAQLCGRPLSNEEQTRIDDIKAVHPDIYAKERLGDEVDEIHTMALYEQQFAKIICEQIGDVEMASEGDIDLSTKDVQTALQTSVDNGNFQRARGAAARLGRLLTESESGEIAAVIVGRMDRQRATDNELEQESGNSEASLIDAGTKVFRELMRA